MLLRQSSKEPKGDESKTESTSTKPWDARRYEELDLWLGLEEASLPRYAKRICIHNVLPFIQLHHGIRHGTKKEHTCGRALTED